MKKSMVSLLLLLAYSFVATAGEVKVTGVTAQQRYPWNGLVDIVVTLAGSSEDLASAYFIFAATNSATKTPLSVSRITHKGEDTGSGTTWTRHFIWDAAADVGNVKIDDVALTVDARQDGVQLWEDGPYWAECNVGASKPEEYGYYFWWGDTIGCQRNASNDGWISVKNGENYLFYWETCSTYGKSDSQLQSAGYIDSTGNLTTSRDAATMRLGAPWRMPTATEIDTLISNCDTTWTTCGGVYGRLVTGRGRYASKSIFLPAAGGGGGSYLDSSGSYGYYWTSAPNSDYSSYAWTLDFYSDAFRRSYFGSRYYGRSVRPVRGFVK